MPSIKRRGRPSKPAPRRAKLISFTDDQLRRIERAMAAQGAENFNEWVRIAAVSQAARVTAT